MGSNLYDSFRSHVRVVVLGASGVGKTALIHQALKTSFLQQYRETVEDTYFCKGDRFLLEIIDTSGSPNFPEMTKIAILEGDVFVLVFSVRDSSTFDRVMQLKKMITETRGEDVSIIVCGNKTDLPDREIPFAMADSVVCIDWGYKYHDVTATDHEKCCDVFTDALMTIPSLRHHRVSIKQGYVVDVPRRKRTLSRKIRKSVSAFFGRLKT